MIFPEADKTFPEDYLVALRTPGIGKLKTVPVDIMEEVRAKLVSIFE